MVAAKRKQRLSEEDHQDSANTILQKILSRESMMSQVNKSDNREATGLNDGPDEGRKASFIAHEPYPSPARAWFVVGVLMVIYVFSFIDRTILNLLVTPIKADLGISDT